MSGEGSCQEKIGKPQQQDYTHTDMKLSHNISKLRQAQGNFFKKLLRWTIITVIFAMYN